MSTRSTYHLPKFSTNKATLDLIQSEICTTQEEFDDWDDNQVLVLEVTTYSVIANIGTYGETFIINKSQSNSGDLADSGANCLMTANILLLRNVRQLRQPIIIGLAVRNTGSVSSSSECTHIGNLTIKCDDGSTFTTTCFYNPNASDTIISLQAIIDESNDFTKWNQSGRKFGQPGQLNFIGPNGTKSITLQQYNGLYFISSASYSIVDESIEVKIQQQPECEGLSANKINMYTQTNLTHCPKKMPPLMHLLL